MTILTLSYVNYNSAINVLIYRILTVLYNTFTVFWMHYIELFTYYFFISSMSIYYLNATSKGYQASILELKKKLQNVSMDTLYLLYIISSYGF